MRAIVFANGLLNALDEIQLIRQPGDLLVAADGGSRHLQALGLVPDILIGDLDSLDEAGLAELQAAGVEVIHYPARKDFTDLELALRLSLARGAKQVLVYGALGARWDQTLANLLLPAAAELESCHIALIDGPQEIRLVRAGETLDVRGRPGDTFSLIPLQGDARGVSTRGLEYPLNNETLYFGATRGISNVLLAEAAVVSLQEGLLLSVLFRQTEAGK